MLDTIKREIIENAVWSGGDWEEIFAAMQEIYGLSFKARREGILALEENLEGIKDEALKFFLSCVVDGMDPKAIEEYMVNLYFSNPCYQKGVKALVFLINAAGILSVQAGDSEMSLTALFKSFVPFSYHDQIFSKEWKEYRERKEKINAAVESGRLEDAIDFVPKEDEFSKEMLAASDEEFKIIKENYEDWGRALKTSVPELIKRMIEDFSSDNIVWFVNLINKPYTAEESENSKKKLLECLERLRKKISLALEGKAYEAFELGPIHDEFSEKMESLSDGQIKILAEKISESELIYVLNFSTPEVINKFAANMDKEKMFYVCSHLGNRSKWEERNAAGNKEKLLNMAQEFFK